MANLNNLIQSLIEALETRTDPASAALKEQLRALNVTIEGDAQGDVNIAGRDIVFGDKITSSLTDSERAMLEEIRIEVRTLTDRRVKSYEGFRRVRVFLSSPGDVMTERSLVAKVVKKVQNEPAYRNHVYIDVVDWADKDKRTPMIASKSPQQAINEGLAKPSESEIVVVVLWARMGTPMPEEEIKPEGFRWSGDLGEERYYSGTEWEYVDAVQAAEISDPSRPLVVVYRRTEAPDIYDPDRAKRVENMRQLDRLESFFESFGSRRGYNPYENPDEFAAIFEQDLRNLISQILEEPEATSAETGTVTAAAESNLVEWPEDKSPFPGLRAFTTQDDVVFFGREKETEELVRRIADTRFIAVVGASGSGKSSLVGAGLIPRLADNALPGSEDWRLPYYEDKQGWSHFRFTPGELGDDPFLPLAMRLQPFIGGMPIQIAADLAIEPTSIVTKLEQCLEGEPEWAKVVLFIDQFEELFTLVSDDETRKRFVELLTAASTNERVRVVITMRSDFADQCAEYPVLNRLVNSNDNTTYYLSRPNRGKLYEMITQPAAVTGLIFEDGLEWRILDDTGDEPGALALTAYALEQLWQERDAQTLTHEVYDSFGGVEGAIGAQAQQAFSKVSLRAREAFRDVFRQLVEINPQTGAATRRRASLNDVYISNAARELIQQLAHARLLVTGHEDDTETVEVAHEALFRSWSTLANWIAEVKDDLVLLRQVINAAAEWATNDYDEAFRWPHERLLLVYDMLERLGKPTLDEDTQRFIEREYDRLIRELRAPLPEIETDEELRAFHRRRAAIGDRLDELGDCDLRPGVGILKETVPLIVGGGDAPMLIGAGEDGSAVREVRLWGDKSEHIGLPDIVFIEVTPPKEPWTMVDENGKEYGPFILKPFYLAKYPVTYAQFTAFEKAEDGFPSGKWYEGLAEQYSDLKDQNRPMGNHPRDKVNWYDSIAFCRWLNNRLGWLDIPFDLTSDNLHTYKGLRLPAEWEWQFAAQNGDKANTYPWGPEWDGRRANTNESGLSRTTAVGLYPPAPCGAFDLSGNVYDWCLNTKDDFNLSLTGGTSRVQRGGAFYRPSRLARPSSRYFNYPYARNNHYGVRLVVGGVGDG